VVERGPGFAEAIRREVPNGADALLDTAILGEKSFGAIRDGGIYIRFAAGETSPPNGESRSSQCACPTCSNVPVKRMANDEKSIKFDYRDGFDFTLTKYNKDYAWGATLNFTGKNAFNATVKNFANVYVANGRVLDVRWDEDETVVSKNLRFALENQYKEQNKAKSKPKKG
jgi:hypothetical protein